MLDESTREAKASTSKTRVVFLIGLMIAELVAVYSLRFLGWNETGNWISWLVAFVVVLFPAVAALLVLVLRGRRFSLRAMLIATTLLAIFVSSVMYPYTQVRQRRRGSEILSKRGIQFACNTQIKRTYALANLEYRQEPDAMTRHTDDIPFWLKPLLNESVPTYPDRAVRLIKVGSDKDLPVVASVLDRFPNLEEVRMNPFGMTVESMEYAAKHFPVIESLSLFRPSIPKNWGKSLKGVRRLSVCQAHLTDDQIKDLMSIDSLESILFDQVNIDDQNVSLLTLAPELKHLTLWRSKLTEVGRQSIVQARPNLIIRLGPNAFTPEHFLGVLHDKPQALFKCTFNQIQSWGRHMAEDGSGMKYYGDSSASIDNSKPLTFEIEDPSQQDPSFVIVTLHQLRQYASRHGFVQKDCQRGEFAAKITFQAARQAR